MAKPLDNLVDHNAHLDGGAGLSVTSYGKLPQVCENQLDRLFRCGSDLLEEKSDTRLADNRASRPLLLTNLAKAV